MINWKKKSIISLKKAKTSLEKIIKMVEEDKYCVDVIQQNLAVIWLVKSANQTLLEWHLSCCFVSAARANDEKRIWEMTQEILKIVKTANK